MKPIVPNQAVQVIALSCAVLMLMTGCAALDKQYHAHVDTQQQKAPITLVKPDASSLTASTDASVPAEGVRLIPAEHADKVAEDNDDDSALRTDSSEWQYHADSRDRYLADQQPKDTTAPLLPWHDPLVYGYHPERTHKALNDYAAQLAMGLMATTSISSNELVGVASFVRLNRNLQEPTVMGNQLAELLIAELQGSGVGVVDFKMSDSLMVTPDGDLAMTRSGEVLSRQLAMDHVLTGTLIEESRGVRVNARIVSVKSGKVVGSSTLLVPAFMVAQLNKAP